MKVKNFSEYTKEEQKELLLHWWSYMDVIPHSLYDVNVFAQFIDKNPEAMFNAALATDSKKVQFNKYYILSYIEHYIYFNECSEFFDVASFYANSSVNKKDRERFTRRVVESYNKPRIAVPLLRNCVFVEDSDLISPEEAKKLTERRVGVLYAKCIIKDVNNDWHDVLDDFIIGEGVDCPAGIFRASSLNECREEIADCISMLPSIDEGVSVLNLQSNKYGKSWTPSFTCVDMLVQLGMAANLLYFPFSKEEVEQLPGGKPFVASVAYDKDYVVEGYKPHTYGKVIAEYRSNK